LTYIKALTVGVAVEAAVICHGGGNRPAASLPTSIGEPLNLTASRQAAWLS